MTEWATLVMALLTAVYVVATLLILRANNRAVECMRHSTEKAHELMVLGQRPFLQVLSCRADAECEGTAYLSHVTLANVGNGPSFIFYMALASAAEPTGGWNGFKRSVVLVPLHHGGQPEDVDLWSGARHLPSDCQRDHPHLLKVWYMDSLGTFYTQELREHVSRWVDGSVADYEWAARASTPVDPYRGYMTAPKLETEIRDLRFAETDPEGRPPSQ